MIVDRGISCSVCVCVCESPSSYVVVAQLQRSPCYTSSWLILASVGLIGSRSSVSVSRGDDIATAEICRHAAATAAAAGNGDAVTRQRR